jgi:hypothetical protein
VGEPVKLYWYDGASTENKYPLIAQGVGISGTGAGAAPPGSMTTSYTFTEVHVLH